METFRVRPGKKVQLERFDPADTGRFAAGDKHTAVKRSRKLQQRLGELQELLYAEHRHRLLVILQGMDTSGKDGAVRHVMSECSPQGVRVVSFKRPTQPELDRDYLWRVHAAVPAAGEIVVFNRSHYEDVLVVRVHEDKPARFWSDRLRQIRDFERMLTENGTTIVKFFLHISKEEQRDRLRARIEDPTKRWKFQHGDLDERKLWDDYMSAYEAVLSATSTEAAPWYIVPANAKWFRNYVVAKTLVEHLEALEMRLPEPDLRDVVVE